MNGATSYSGMPNQVGLVLYPAATVTVASTTFGAIFGGPPPALSLGEYQEAMFLLEVTAAAAAGGDTLDVFVQTTFDPAPQASSVWIDIVHFAQIIGTATPPKRYIDKVIANQAQAEFENGSALAASGVRHIFGDAYRVKVTVVDGGAHGQSFTFSVTSNWK